MIAHGWRPNLKDVGDQALMRGLDTAFPRCVRGYPDLTVDGMPVLSGPPALAADDRAARPRGWSAVARASHRRRFFSDRPAGGRHERYAGGGMSDATVNVV
jgi:hypothetical protein